MLHISAERLAALADDEPSAEEASHLETCAECTRARRAHESLLIMTARQADILNEPLTTWPVLAGLLRAEGLIRDTGDASATHSQLPAGTPGRRSPASRWWLQAAAAVALAVGGAFFGRWSVAGLDGGFMASDSGRTSTTPVSSRIGRASEVSSTSFSSVTEAITVLERAQRDYRAAAAFLTAMDTGSLGGENPDRFRTRLAALDQIQGAALSAANEAPTDPMIGQYYEAALTARQVTLRQLGNALPTGVRLAGY
ncbi:MAG: hypothetical protein ABR543_14225 [Gemmatimonadaceae bacterium]